MNPNFNEEKKLWKKRYKRIAGLDEAGRGPLAGPVVAVAVAINPKLKILSPKQTQNQKYKIQKKFRDLRFRILLSEVKDSKKLSSQKREELYKVINNCSAIEWGIGIVSEKVIDKINILAATKLAMKKAIKKLKIKPNHLILDGKMKLDLPIPQKSIIKGDEKVFSCAAASIIAKVSRDRIMVKLHKKYPKYGFNIHKGYPTKLHLKMLKKYGPCKIHRKTFGPVKTCQIK